MLQRLGCLSALGDVWSIPKTIARQPDQCGSTRNRAIRRGAGVSSLTLPLARNSANRQRALPAGQGSIQMSVTAQISSAL